MDEPLTDAAVSAEPGPPSPPEPSAAAPAARPKVKARRPDPVVTRRFLIELLTITAAVLMALSLEGGRQWIQDRRLVARANANIQSEIRDNLQEIEIVIASMEGRRQNIRTALQLANELIENQSSMIQQVNLGFEWAELSAASWDTAARRGALALMSYGEARAYARAYEAQEMFLTHQSRMLDELEAAAANMTADPYGALPGDIESFREHLLALMAMMSVEPQLTDMLVESYRSALGEEPRDGSGS